MVEQPRIALFLPTLGYGGVERMALNLCGGFLEYGASVDVVVADAAGELRSEIPNGVRLVDLRAKRVLTSVPRLGQYLQQHRPQALICYMTHCSLAAILARYLARTRTRIIATEHVPISVIASHSKRLRVKAAAWTAKKFLPQADEIVAVSTAVAADLTHWLNLENKSIHVIPNPVISDRLYKLAAMVPLHPWFQQREETPVILSVGRLSKEKDQATLLRAFARVQKETRARLLILGEGEERARLEQVARSLGMDDVSLPGYEPNPYSFMKKASAFVLSSRWEGFGVALVEALALNGNVVCTDCPGAPKEILQNGELGRLVPVGDYEQMAAALQEALRCAKSPVGSSELRQYHVRNVVEKYAALVQLPALEAASSAN